MQLFGRLFGGARQNSTADPRFPKEWCVFALLYAAAMADNVIAPEEEVEVDALLLRAQSLFNMSQQQVSEYVAQYRTILENQNSVAPLTALACEKMPSEPGLPEAVFAHCVDIVSSDRIIVHDEEEFLADLGETLGLTKAVRDDILEVMNWKNAF